MKEEKPLGFAKHKLEAGGHIRIELDSTGEITSPDMELTEEGKAYFRSLMESDIHAS